MKNTILLLVAIGLLNCNKSMDCYTCTYDLMVTIDPAKSMLDIAYDQVPGTVCECSFNLIVTKNGARIEEKINTNKRDFTIKTPILAGDQITIEYYLYYRSGTNGYTMAIDLSKNLSELEMVYKKCIDGSIRGQPKVIDCE